MAKRGLEMLASQYNESPNLKKYIQCLLDECLEVQTAISDTITYRYLNESYGVMVDDIAYIVGASRILYGAAALGYYGYYHNPEAEPLGDDSIPGEGGMLKSDTDRNSGDLIRSDVQLKSAIRARIIKTVTNCKIDDIYRYCDLSVGRNLPLEIKQGKLKLEYIYHGKAPIADKVLLAYMIPDITPAGITATFKDDAGDIELVYESTDYPANVL